MIVHPMRVGIEDCPSLRLKPSDEDLVISGVVLRIDCVW